MEQLPWLAKVKILRMLSFMDLQNLKQVSKHFHHFISMELKSWLRDTFIANVFPHSETIYGLLRLASAGNIEATIELAVILPYQDSAFETATGPKGSNTLAAEMYCRLENCKMLNHPLTWMFIRPPWSKKTVCKRALVYRHILKLIESGEHSANLCYCIGKVHLFEEDAEKAELARSWLEKSSSLGSLDAKFELWKWRVAGCWDVGLVHRKYSLAEPGTRLCLIRELRSLAGMNYYPAERQLCQLYASGHHDGVSAAKACCTVKNFFLKSRPLRNKHFRLLQYDVNALMRYTLVDWLVEVATMKYFSNQTLHLSVQCVDRYLSRFRVSRVYFQLLGIACMVICSRCLEKQVLTIREAVWLTDSSYKYSELVLFLGDIVSTLSGNIKLPTIIDYLEVLLMMQNISEKTKILSRFIADASIFYADVGLLCPAKVACSCVLLARLTTNPGNVPWTEEMNEFTGFSVSDLQTTTVKLYENCITMRVTGNQQRGRLTALEDKYDSCLYGPITTDQIVDYEGVVQFFDHHRESVSDRVSIKDQPLTVSNPTSTSLCFPVACGCKGACSGTHYLPDDALDTDTPSISCAYVAQDDVKARKRIHSGGACSSNALSSLSCDVGVVAAKSNENAEILSAKDNYGNPNACSRKSETFGDENREPSAKREKSGHGANANSEENSNGTLPRSSKSMKLLR